jgi:LysM repeat protein
MKFFALSALLANALCVAAPLEFSAYVLVDGKPNILITDLGDQKTSGFIRVGQSFRGYSLVSFDPKAARITLQSRDESLTLTLKGSKVGEAAQKDGGRPPAPSGPGVYTTKPGDTGLKIARQANLSIAELQALNPGVNWARLSVGQEIRIRARE